MFFISQPRVFGPKTEHESFFYVADLVYAAGESARNKTAALTTSLASTLTHGSLAHTYNTKHADSHNTNTEMYT